MNEVLLIVIVSVAAPIAIIGVVSWLLHSVIALNSPPRIRAQWLAGISYIVTSGFWLFGGSAGDRWQGPIAAIPAGLLAFWFWHREFRHAWIEEGHAVPDGVKLANSDWKVGVIALIGMIVAAAIKAIFLRGALGQ